MATNNSRTCTGDGMCLNEVDENLYTKDPSIICTHNCQPIKCANFLLCGSILPKQYLKVDALCVNCDMMFGPWQGGIGTLNFTEVDSCVICMNEGNPGTGEGVPAIVYPKCEGGHAVCVSCFKRCFYGEEVDDDGEPPFPYPQEIYDAYQSNPDTSTFANDPLIIEWNQKWNAWDDIRQQKREVPKYLQKCPLCRK